MDAVAITTSGYGGKVCFVDDTALAYAAGHGVVLHDLESGVQKHIWTLPEGQGIPPANYGAAVFASCPGGHLLAYVQHGAQGQSIQVVQQETLMPASTIKDASNKSAEYVQLAFNADGTRLLSICSAPDHQLDVWDVDTKEALVRVPLPNTLVGLDAAFFPHNGSVLAVAGPEAARIVWAEPLAGTHVVRQSEVDLSLLGDGERLTCMCWTPNGTLLLGTSQSRLLGVRNAAPPAIPASGWGVHAAGGHEAELLYGPSNDVLPAIQKQRSRHLPGSSGAAAVGEGDPASQPNLGVVAVITTSLHVLLVMAGDALTSGQLLWLCPDTLRLISEAVLPLHLLARACCSPSYMQLALSGADGTVSVCNTTCPASGSSVTGMLARGGSNSQVPLGLLAVTSRTPSSSNLQRPQLQGGGGSSGLGQGLAGGASGGEQWLPSPTAGPPAGTRQGSCTSLHHAAFGVKGAPMPVMEIARFHRGHISSCLWLSNSRFVTGALDGTVRLWSYVSLEGDVPPSLPCPTPAVLPEAIWHVDQPVTCMAALSPPAPATPRGAAASSAASSNDGGPTPSHGSAAGRGRGAPSLPPAFLLGTSGGAVQLINADRLPADPEAAADLNQLARSLSSTWEVKLFDAAVSAAAFSQDGNYCAVSCVAEGKVAMLRVVVLGHELSMRLLGFYGVREPKHVAWAPPDPTGPAHPLLVVSSVLGEVQVLDLPDASAMESCGEDGLLPRGSLLRATMRAQSHITALAVVPAPPAQAGPAQGHFWVFTAHSDKSLRRFRMMTDQQKAAGSMAARAAAAEAAAQAQAHGRTPGRRPPSGSTGAGGTRGSAAASTSSSMQSFQLPESEKPMEMQLPATTLSITILPPQAANSNGAAVGGAGGALRMALGCPDGSVAVYSLPELAFQGRWLLHELPRGGATGVCLLGDQLLSVGGEGTVQVLELAPAVHRTRAATTARAGGTASAVGSAIVPPLGARSTVLGKSSVFSMSGPPRPRGIERAALGSLVPVHMRAMLPGIHTGADGAPTWQQSRAQATQQLHREQLASFRGRVQAKCRAWADKIRELKQLNDAADEVERLKPEEFVIDTELRQQLLAHGEERHAAVKAQLQHQMQVMEVIRQRLKQQCLGAMEAVAQPLVPLREYTFLSPMDPAEVKRFRFDGDAAAARTIAEGGVWSYGMRRLTPEQQRRQRQVAFLRRVELAEHALRAPMDRGGIVPIRRYKGDMNRRYSIVADEAQQGQGGGDAPGAGMPGAGGAAPPAAGAPSQPPPGILGGQGGGQQSDDEDDGGPPGGGLTRSMTTRRTKEAEGFEGAELGYGETGLLYSEVQLYTHCRRAAQVVLIQDEIAALERLFNSRWQQVRTAKQKALDKVDERLGRIVEIQKELTRLALDEGCGEAPAPAPGHKPAEFYHWTPEEEMFGLQDVKDDEVKVERYVSPEEMARRAAASAADAEARRLAEQDDAKNRALREMMNNTPEVARRSKAAKNALVREAWMDMPPTQMTKEQRLKLQEWERKRQEMAEELEKQRRILEAERRALEVEIAEAAAAVNTDITRLANAKVRVEMELVHLSRQAVDTAATAATLAATDAVRSALAGELKNLTTRRAKRAPLLGALEHQLALAQRTYEDITLAEKQVDKAFRREFSSRPDIWDDAQKVYRDRAHLDVVLESSPADLTPRGPAAAGSKLPRKTPLELLGKAPEGAVLLAALEADAPAPPALSRSASMAALSRAASRRMPAQEASLSHLAPGGAAGPLSAVPPGPAGPDGVVLTTPRSVVRDMAQLARPQQRPGSPVHSYAREHATGPVSVDKDARRGGPVSAPASPTARSRSLPRSMTRRGITGGEERPIMAALAQQRGARLRGLVAKTGRTLEPLMQMVADGLPSSALLAELGNLGLALDANSLDNLDPYAVPGAARLFDPVATGVADAHVNSGYACGIPLGPGGHAAAREVTSQGSRSNHTTANGGHTAMGDEDDEDPLDSAERPEGMEDAMWLRLLEFRQTRFDLEKDAEVAWRKTSLLAAQLDWLEAEDAEMEAQVEEAGARAAALRDSAARAAADVCVTYRLKNGQVELPDCSGDVVGYGDQLADAVVLHRNRVETVNEEVQERGEHKIELLESLHELRRTIHLTVWEVGAGELAGKHAAQRLTELQLMHVTKDLQAALRDPTVVDRMNEEARLAIVQQSATQLHGHRVELRRRQLAVLQARLGKGGAERGELSMAETAAETAYQESARMHTMLAHTQAAEDSLQRRHMRNIVTNAQLRDISQQQAAELAKLSAALQQAHARSFPSLRPNPTGAAWVPPDYVPPSSRGAPGSAAGMAAGGRFASVPGPRPPSSVRSYGVQGAHRSYTNTSAAAAGGAGGGGRPSSQPRTAWASRPSSSVPVPPRPGSVTRSGGAGASLTRALHAAGGAGGVGVGPAGPAAGGAAGQHGQGGVLPRPGGVSRPGSTMGQPAVAARPGTSSSSSRRR